jgi:hypothetical protein
MKRLMSDDRQQETAGWSFSGWQRPVRGPVENASGERFHSPIAEGREPEGKGFSTFLTQAGAGGFDPRQIRQERVKCFAT